MQTLRRLAGLTAACACVLALGGGAASAATFEVTTTDDEVDAGACTPADVDCALRAAIIAANSAAGLDTIRIPAGTRWRPAGSPPRPAVATSSV